jgi:DHA2 family multidrug resistance protein
VDPRLYASGAVLSFAASFFLRSQLSPDANYGAFVMANLASGIGLGAFFVSLTTVQFQAIPPSRLAAASGIANFGRITAGGFVASVLATVWDRRAALHQSQIADGQQLHSPVWAQALANLQGLGNSYDTSIDMLTQQVTNQSYHQGVFDLFWLAGWACLVMTPLIWLTPRPPAHH